MFRTPVRLHAITPVHKPALERLAIIHAVRPAAIQLAVLRPALAQLVVLPPALLAARVPARVQPAMWLPARVPARVQPALTLAVRLPAHIPAPVHAGIPASQPAMELPVIIHAERPAAMQHATRRHAALYTNSAAKITS